MYILYRNFIDIEYISIFLNVLGSISKKEGVESIDVSLENKEAIVSYFPKQITPDAISTAIYDMGFDTALLEINGLKHKGMISS